VRRRTLLAAVAASAAAGCTSSGGVGGPADSGAADGSPSSADTDTDTATPTDTPTATDTGGAAASVSTVEADAGRVRFERTGECAPGDSGASVEVDSGVVVTGCIQGSTGCSQPSFGSARLAEDRLVVTVDTVETGDICTQQLVYRSYTARVETSGDLPATVEVRHGDDGDTTTVAETTV